MEYVDGVHAGQLFKHGGDRSGCRRRWSRGSAPTPRPRSTTPTSCARADGKPLGLVHRDVSPANIMVSFDGVVKLCDFGIAKAAALGDQLTNPGQVKGKYAYMSPEQTIAAPLDGRSDVFSLAIVLWELLAGKTIVVARRRGRRRCARSATASCRRSRASRRGCPPPLAKAIDVGARRPSARSARPRWTSRRRSRRSSSRRPSSRPRCSSPRGSASGSRARRPGRSAVLPGPAGGGGSRAGDPGRAGDGAQPARHAGRPGDPGDAVLADAQSVHLTGDDVIDTAETVAARQARRARGDATRP